uniref:Uncharacterized protein n=1 Tax=virus sp. ct1Uu26 TaxID=2826789 RepID=A0A8S5R8P0_9VIRU|nr:MAG TPA: hypothetical protein [virus sp. ct1Uu26]
MLDIFSPLQVLMAKNIIIQILGLSDGEIKDFFTLLLVSKSGFIVSLLLLIRRTQALRW